MSNSDRIAAPRATPFSERPKATRRTLGRIYVEIIAISYAVVGLAIGLIVCAHGLLASSG